MPILPTLSAWAASRLTSILESKAQDNFNVAFDATFAADCNITVNGKCLSRDEYKAQLIQQSAAGFGESGTTVTIQNQAEIELGDQGQLSGLVGIFYTTISDSKFLVLGAPAESRATSSINLLIEPTEKNPQNPNIPVRGYFDPRRVVSVNQVVAESTYHVTIPAASVPKGTTSEKPSSNIELGPGPVILPQKGPFGGNFGPGPVHLPPSETGAVPETLPGDGEFGVGPVVVPGDSLGQATT